MVLLIATRSSRWINIDKGNSFDDHEKMSEYNSWLMCAHENHFCLFGFWHFAFCCERTLLMFAQFMSQECYQRAARICTL